MNKFTLILTIFLFYSCTNVVKEAKTIYFSNQLTPTINTSLTYISSMIKCISEDKSINFNTIGPIVFTIRGKKSFFRLERISSNSKCNDLRNFKPINVDYKNKLIRWVNTEKEKFTSDSNHSKLYNFENMYKNTTYQIVAHIKNKTIDINIERIDSNNSLSERLQDGARFYEQFSFNAYLDVDQKIRFYDEFLDKDSRFYW